VVVLVVVLVWLVALTPIALRRHSAHQLDASVARFRRQRRLLERAYRSRLDGRDFAPAPDRISTAPQHSRRSHHSSRSSGPDMRLRRRRVLVVSAGALAFSLVLGAVPALRAFWMISILLAVALVIYLVLLARVVSMGTTRRPSVDDGAPESWVSAHRHLEEASDTRMPWVRLLVEENSA
jgi:uncharacterized membrane protein